MSWNFDGSTDYWNSTTVPVTGTPFTTSAWFYPNDTTTNGMVWQLHDSGVANHYFYMWATGSVASAALRFAVALGGAATTVDTTNTYSATTWNHGCIIATAVNARRVVLNGDWANSNTSTFSRLPLNIDESIIGAFDNVAAVGNYFPGNIAGVAVWNAALVQAEVEALNAGMSPLLIRPASLVSYNPMQGNNDPLIDVMGGSTYNGNGTPVKSAEHPAIYHPRARIIIPDAAAAAGPAGPIMNQFQGNLGADLYNGTIQ
jgi:hypothetical protein